MRRTALVAACTLAVMLPAIPVADASSDQPREYVSRVVNAPEGFQVDEVFTGLTRPTEVAFANTGHIFVAEKRGRIKVFDGVDDTGAHTVVDMEDEVYDYTDHGLLGMAIDPQWPADPYLYIMYAHDSNPWTGSWDDNCNNGRTRGHPGCVSYGRLSRITIDLAGTNPTYVPGSEVVLVDHRWCFQSFTHSVGKVFFDGNVLYASGGDGAAPIGMDWGQWGGTGGSEVPKNPCGDPPGGVGADLDPPDAEGGALRSQDLMTPGDPVGLNGTVIRVKQNGKPLASNPLYGGAIADDDAVIAFGLRNPYAMTLRPNGEIWVGDTGWDSWEEVNRITNDGSVPNFGWPCYEGAYDQNGGYSARQSAYDAANLDICEDLYSDPSQVTAPFYSWSHENGLVGCDGPGGRNGEAVTGLAFYDGGEYPALFDGALFIANYAAQCVIAFPLGDDGLPDPNRYVRMIDSFSPVSLKVGPDGNIWGVDVFQGKVVRLVYESDNSAPIASFTADQRGGDGSLRYDFDASATTDLEDSLAELTFDWDLDGDGDYDDATGVQVTKRYNKKKTVTARLRVTDLGGKTDTAAVEIYPGNQFPRITELLPGPGVTWSVGDEIVFSAKANDPDGPLPPSAYEWEVNLHHCEVDGGCHIHFISTESGTKTGVTVGSDHEYPSWIELVLTVTDESGAQTRMTRELQPNTTKIKLRGFPTDVEIGVGSHADTTPFAETVIVGATVTVAAPDQVQGGVPYTFASWSNGQNQSHNFTAPARNTTLTATFTGPPGPKLHSGVVSGVTDEWTTVEVPFVYDTMVVVATPDYSPNRKPAVPRIRKATGNTFQVRLQSPSGAPVKKSTVRFMVAEEGVWTEAEHGVTMEAVRFKSTKTDRAGSWKAQKRQYGQPYAEPVVIGQVMSHKDPDWSVFWSRGQTKALPPSPDRLKVGKHVGQDADTTRKPEKIGYMVFEAGLIDFHANSFKAGVTDEYIPGTKNAPHTHGLGYRAVSTVATLTGLHVDDGGWVVVKGSEEISDEVAMFIDEDQLFDNERSHKPERVAYVAQLATTPPPPDGVWEEIVLADNPSVWWRLGESPGSSSAADQVASVDGTYEGDPTLGVDGLADGIDTAVEFDGVDDLVTIPDDPAVNTGLINTRTIEVWFEAHDVETRSVIFEHGGVDRGMTIYVDEGLLWMGAYHSNDGPGDDTPWGPLFTSMPIEAGTRYHVALVLDRYAGTFEAFVNGESVERFTNAGRINVHASNAGIGAMFNATKFHDGVGGGAMRNFYFDGIIDEVVIYATALSAQRIEAHYSAVAR